MNFFGKIYVFLIMFLFIGLMAAYASNFTGKSCAQGEILQTMACGSTVINAKAMANNLSKEGITAITDGTDNSVNHLLSSVEGNQATLPLKRVDTAIYRIIKPNSTLDSDLFEVAVYTGIDRKMFASRLPMDTEVPGTIFLSNVGFAVVNGFVYKTNSSNTFGIYGYS